MTGFLKLGSIEIYNLNINQLGCNDKEYGKALILHKSVNFLDMIAKEGELRIDCYEKGNEIWRIKKWLIGSIFFLRLKLQEL